MYGDHVKQFRKDYISQLLLRLEWLEEKEYSLKQVGNVINAKKGDIKITFSFGQYFEEAIVQINHMDGNKIKSKYSLSDLLNILSVKHLTPYFINNQLYKRREKNEYIYEISSGDNYIKIIAFVNFLYDYFEVLTETNFIYNAEKIIFDKAVLQSKFM